MAIYEYRCEQCERRTEAVFPMGHAAESVQCFGCNGRAVRVYSAPAISFKGSGFYNTDYKNKVKGDKQAKDEKKDEKKPPQEVKKDADKKVEKPNAK